MRGLLDRMQIADIESLPRMAVPLPIRIGLTAVAAVVLALPTALGQTPTPSPAPFVIPEEIVYQYLAFTWDAPGVRFGRLNVQSSEFIGALCRAYALFAQPLQQTISRDEFIRAWHFRRLFFSLRERQVSSAIYDETRTLAKVTVTLTIANLLNRSLRGFGGVWTIAKEAEGWRLLLFPEQPSVAI